MFKTNNITYIIEQYSHYDIKVWEKRSNELQKFFWDHYCYFAHQRSMRLDNILNALRKNSSQYNVSGWIRILPSKFSSTPFSSQGSILHSLGGRFNIGDIDQTKFPRFGGLYIASNYETAFREKFSIEKNDNFNGLTSDELVMNGKTSMASFLLNGSFNNVLNLCKPNALNDFLKTLKDIQLPTSLIQKARILKVPVASIQQVQTLSLLMKSLVREDWRIMPNLFDIPSNSQILGQLVFLAGLEGIIYPSFRTSEECAVLYPANFCNSSSYLEIADEVAAYITQTRLDNLSFDKF